MKKRTSLLISISTLAGVLAFISGFAVALPIAEISGIAILPGVIMPFVINLIFVSASLITDGVGVATLSSITYGIMSIPFPILGPPGFVFKILVITLPTILIDVMVRLRPSKWGSATAGLLGSLPVNPLMIIFFALFGIPFEFMLPILIPLEVAVAVTGSFGGILAWRIANGSHFQALRVRIN